MVRRGTECPWADGSKQIRDADFSSANLTNLYKHSEGLGTEVSGKCVTSHLLDLPRRTSSRLMTQLLSRSARQIP